MYSALSLDAASCPVVGRDHVLVIPIVLQASVCKSKLSAPILRTIDYDILESPTVVLVGMFNMYLTWAGVQGGNWWRGGSESVRFEENNPSLLGRNKRKHERFV